MEFKDGEEGIIETAFLLGTFEGEVAKQVVVYNPAYSFRHPCGVKRTGSDRTGTRAQIYR